MASKWANKQADDYFCRTDPKDCLADRFDAAAEEVANIAADESRFWSAESKKEFAKRVLDKRGR